MYSFWRGGGALAGSMITLPAAVVLSTQFDPIRRLEDLEWEVRSRCHCGRVGGKWPKR